ncbi:MAG: sulfotransferase [Myxococcota bacterium]|nr:sulfotransferase [Myxococcota bacterium]
MPLFMIGMQRSGSNLLRLMLNQLPSIAAPHPPHILERLGPFESLYGDLSDDGNFLGLIDDVCRLVETNPVRWESVNLDRKAIAESCIERSLIAVYGRVHDCLASEWGADDWLCKSMANVHYLDEIERYFGESARYIFLYRDGRDVALSFRKALIGDKTFYHLGKSWHETQQLALDLRARVDPQQFFGISYEELVADPEAVLRRLCRFLGTEYSPSMMNFHESQEASRTAVTGLWSNVSRPVNQANCAKFLNELGPQEIELFEQVAGDSLDALDYPRYFVESGSEKNLSQARLAALDSENERLKEAAVRNSDPKDLELRQPQAELMNSIQARFA